MWFILTSTVVSLVTIYHLWSKYKFDYWSKRGIKGPRAAFLSPFGNFRSVVRKKERITEVFQNYSDQFPNESVVGLHIGFKPLLMVKDPEYIQQILIKDFNTFENRGFPNPENRQGLFMSTGDNWRTLRQHIRPLFSTGKLKAMVPDILKCCDDVLKNVDTCREKNSEHEMRYFTTRCTAAMAGCILGVDYKPFTKNSNELIEIIEKYCIIPSTSPRMLFNMIPRIKYLIDIFFPLLDDFHNYSSILLRKLLQRGKRQNAKEDTIDVLKRFQDQGRVIGNFENRVHTLEMNNEILVSILMSFLINFEPTASFIALTFHELAIHQEIQKKAYNEIKDITEKHNGILTYEALQEMTYSQMVYKETLRKYSGPLFRVASEDFTFSNTSGTKIHIEKGTNIVIPSAAVHMDSKYFENPHGFHPERFSPENETKIPACSFTPFGEGPRQCIGNRLALLQSLAILATFLSRFKLEATEKTARHVKLDPTSISTKAISGSWVKISKRT